MNDFFLHISQSQSSSAISTCSLRNHNRFRKTWVNTCLAESPRKIFVVFTMASIPTSKLPQPPLDGAQCPTDKVEDSRCQNLVQGRIKRLSSAVEKTVDRLSRSVGGVSPPSSTSTSPTTRRVFSLSRKNRTVDSAGMLSTSVAIPPTSESMPIITKSQSNNATVSHAEDSPFIRPPSPPIRPSLRQSLGGDGSVWISLKLSRFITQSTSDARWNTNADPSSTGLALDV